MSTNVQYATIITPRIRAAGAKPRHLLLPGMKLTF